MTEILVGREEHTDFPRLAVNIKGSVFFVGDPGCVTKHMSRKHCKVIVEDNGSISVYDVTSNNFIFVNGKEYKQKTNLSAADKVELGYDRYPLDLSELLAIVSSLQEYSIAPLGQVYEDYQKRLMKYLVKQEKMTALTMLPGGLSMLSGVLGLVFDDKAIRIPMLILAVLSLISIFLIKYLSADVNSKKKIQIEDAFHERYVCPNPACHQFLGAHSFTDLQHMHSCPHCKAKWVTK